MGFTNSLLLIKNINIYNKINQRLYLNTIVNNARHLKTRKTADEVDNKPLPFLKSSAANIQAHRVTVSYDKQPWYQPYVVLASTAIFLIYFCVLREENDVDAKLSRSLYEHIDGLEEKQFEIRIKYNIEHNLDTKDLEERLLELRTMKTENVNKIEN